MCRAAAARIIARSLSFSSSPATGTATAQAETPTTTSLAATDRDSMAVIDLLLGDAMYEVRAAALGMFARTLLGIQSPYVCLPAFI